MNSEDKSQDTQERQDDSNAPETAEGKQIRTAERERMSRIADQLAQRAKKRQVDYEGHKIFTK